MLPLTALHKALLTFVSVFEYTGLVIHLLAYDLVDQYQGTTVFDDLFLYFVPFSDSISVPVSMFSSCPSCGRIFNGETKKRLETKDQGQKSVSLTGQPLQSVFG